MMASIDLETIPRPQVIAELQLEGVGVDPNPIDVVEEAHVPDIENQGERAFRDLLWRYFFRESCPE